MTVIHIYLYPKGLIWSTLQSHRLLQPHHAGGSVILWSTCMPRSLSSSVFSNRWAASLLEMLCTSPSVLVWALGSIKISSHLEDYSPQVHPVLPVGYLNPPLYWQSLPTVLSAHFIGALLLFVPRSLMKMRPILEQLHENLPSSPGMLFQYNLLVTSL